MEKTTYFLFLTDFVCFLLVNAQKKAKVEESEDEESSEEESDVESEEEEKPKPKKTKTVKKTPTKKSTPAKKTPASKSKGSEEPLFKLSVTQIKSDLESVLSKLSPNEYGQLTVKIMLAKMQDFYGYDVRPRKADFKAAMNEYADAHPPSADSPEKKPKEEVSAAEEAVEADAEQTE